MTTQQQAGDPQAADRLTRVEGLLQQLVGRMAEARQVSREDLASQRYGISRLPSETGVLRREMDARLQHVNERIDRLLDAVAIGLFILIIAGGVGAFIGFALSG